MRRVTARVSTPQMPDRPPVGRIGDVGAQHDAARHRVHALDVFQIGADIADVREGEGDDLAGVGRIGDDLLVAGHRGIEADLARLDLGSADALAPEDGAVGQHQRGRRATRRGDFGAGGLS
jgi:hypothetical protein